MTLELISSLSNVILAIATLVSLIVAYKSLSLTKLFSEKQLKILSHPYLFLAILVKKTKNYLELVNNTNLPAFDLDIIIISVFFDEEVPFGKFVKKHLTKGLKYKITTDKEGFYYLYDRLYYQIAPVNKRLIAQISTVNDPSQFFVMVQYRDIFGINYAQEYWFTKSFRQFGRSGYLKLSNLQPIPIRRSPRVDFKLDRKMLEKEAATNTYEGIELITENKQRFPRFLLEVRRMLKHSVSSGHIRSQVNDVEDRGTWTSL
jgi:hypothetical protein